ncbi:hypothetical protein [Streptomyces sp. NPDC090112]|uniref:hypothetical protein n=1 Tax=Streptomyces sp. NPDC090112 TaxID=3365949 RepID=UPI003813413B
MDGNSSAKDSARNHFAAIFQDAKDLSRNLADLPGMLEALKKGGWKCYISSLHYLSIGVMGGSYDLYSSLSSSLATQATMARAVEVRKAANEVHDGILGLVKDFRKTPPEGWGKIMPSVGKILVSVEALQEHLVQLGEVGNISRQGWVTVSHYED